jgi:hypothetical protein
MVVFGIVMLIGFGLLGGLLYWSWRAGGGDWRRTLAAILWTIGGITFLWGLASPRTLRPISHLWIAFGERLGTIVSTVMLSILYFFVMTTVGLLMRLTGTDPLERRPAPARSGYWRAMPPAARTHFEHMS